MKIQQTLQKCLDDWNRISGLDFCILDENDQIYISTGDRRLPSSEKLAQFREDPALCISNRSCSLYKLNNIPQSNMLLIVWGSGEQASTIGELAHCLYGKNRQELLYAKSSPGPLFPGRSF